MNTYNNAKHSELAVIEGNMKAEGRVTWEIIAFYSEACRTKKLQGEREANMADST